MQPDNIEQLIQKMADSIRQEVRESETRLREHAEAVETRLLSEFWKWARTADARYRQNNGQVAGIDERLGLLEGRVTELEGGRA
jgi:hypothetical protein